MPTSYTKTVTLTPSPGPEYHGNDLAGAYVRARKISGHVITSTPPASPDDPARRRNNPLPDGYGYWSDDSGMIRHTLGERLVYSYHQRRSLGRLQILEAAHYAKSRR
jgi:hypothetical protein